MAWAEWVSEEAVVDVVKWPVMQLVAGMEARAKLVAQPIGNGVHDWPRMWHQAPL